MAYGFSPVGRSKGSTAALSARSTAAPSMAGRAFAFAKAAAYSPARFPNTTMSERELPPSRLAPLIPEAHSPAAKSPGTFDIWVSPSTRMPPMM
jgi:hypothetical protein